MQNLRGLGPVATITIITTTTMVLGSRIAVEHFDRTFEVRSPVLRRPGFLTALISSGAAARFRHRARAGAPGAGRAPGGARGGEESTGTGTGGLVFGHMFCLENRKRIELVTQMNAS